ncbi:MAG TPA: hypothetical protein VK196_03105 [Magnetospirillum sp.]|nr:hypothetical protein [Magnetospirillum sp.]
MGMQLFRVGRSYLFVCLVLQACWVLGKPLAAAELTVRYPVPTPPFGIIYDYFGQVLDLALSKTVERYGPYRLAPIEMRASNLRLNVLLEAGEDVDLLLVSPNRERDQRFIPVRIPLDKGMLGYRVLMIRAGDADRFAEVRSADDLKHITLGQGFDWEDMHILTAAGYDVEAGSDYSSLLDMLLLGRFNGFPRGVYEIDNEIDFHTAAGRGGMAVENTLMLHYRSTRIVYVNKKNAALAQRIEEGLRAAIKDGSFDALFLRHPTIAKGLALANAAGRRTFELPNPRFPPDFPVDDPTLWYRPAPQGRMSELR